MDTDNISNCDIDEIFKRQFDFKKECHWTLPLNIEESDLWNIHSLTALKKDLNNIKSLLNDKGQDWHDHTANINKASYVIKFIKEKIQPEILTQAWCKFYEILSNFNLLPSKTSIQTLHICEAPGAFISALNYYLCLNQPVDWHWMANTLNPYYEGHSIRSVVVDDRLILPTLRHWYFGEDNTGDITASSFLNNICNFAEKFRLYDLITADGSIDCLDNPAEQESVLGKLHFCEVIVALSCLAPNGSFVLKKFTFFECSSICILYVLNCVFQKVHVFKPFTSRPSNSEVYVICLGFSGSEALSKLLQWYKDIYCTQNKVAIFPLSVIPSSFIEQIENCMKYFTDLQIRAIEENLALHPLMKTDEILEKLDNLKVSCANMYIQKYGIFASNIYDASKLFSKKKTLASFNCEYQKNMKSLYFEAVGDTFNNIIRSSSMQWYDKIMDVEKRINSCFPSSRKRPYEKIEWISPWKEVRKRMKSKTFKNWIVYGKKVSCIQNSKFCNPLLLHLWNRLSLDAKITLQSHVDNKYHWYSEDSLGSSLKNDSDMLQNIIVVSALQKYESDPLLLHLKENYNSHVGWCLNEESDNVNLSSENKIVYINTTTWAESLHNECSIKGIFSEVLLLALKILKAGDTLLLCVQSILTRYSAGLMFLIISLFEKFTTLLPEDSAPACSAQLWVFKNYQNCNWISNVHQYLKLICEQNSTLSEKDILEIVPMGSLCDVSFLAYLKNLNSKHLLQRLKSLVKIEKCKIEKCK